jgi:hypothetical protein
MNGTTEQNRGRRRRNKDRPLHRASLHRLHMFVLIVAKFGKKWKEREVRKKDNEKRKRERLKKINK